MVALYWLGRPFSWKPAQVLSDEGVVRLFSMSLEIDFTGCALASKSTENKIIACILQKWQPSI